MTKILNIKTREELKFSSLKKGETHKLHIHISNSALGTPWKVPIIVARGEKPGPTLGITAAVHGNELNGLSTIFKLFEEIDLKKLAGQIVAVPVSNIPGYLNKTRYFSDGQDLNRVMPGKPTGKPAEIYSHFFTSKIVKHFDYHLDLHTASFGKVNSLYIRADLDNEKTRQMAMLQSPHIIVQKYDEEGTLRAWANSQGIPSITIEIGNPNTFQHNLIDDTLEGIVNTMRALKMYPGKVRDLTDDAVICDRSFWIFSYTGGVIDVVPNLTDHIKEGDLIAKVYNVFGELKEEIRSSHDGVVIGKNVSPCCEAGDRILHLGIVGDQ